MPKENFPVLLVEDNKHDVMFVQKAWKLNKITNPLFVVQNGQACLDYLYQRNEYCEPANAPRPGIILMDIRMPVMDGIECLQHIRSDPALQIIPVIMLTTSVEDEDRLRSYQIGCNSYIQKPVSFEKLGQALRTIHLFWTISELP